MKRITVASLLVLASFFASAQDSTRVITHEIGFNTVNLLTQFGLKTGNVTQLPYDIFYNIFYKNKVGVRVGVGVITSYAEQQVNKQQYPLEHTANNFNMRIGANYNFVSNRILTFNGFADFIYEKVKLESASSATAQVFPNPIITTSTRSTDIINGSGFQIGVGLKANLYRNLSLYIETPFVYMYEKRKTRNFTSQSGSDDQNLELTNKSRMSTIVLPATFYLVLRF